LRRGELLRRSCLVVLSSLLAIALAEVVLRVGGQHIVAEGEWLAVGRLLKTDDDLLGYSLNPGSRRLATMGGDFAFITRINSAGFRDVDHPVEKPLDRKRILVLGDSFIFGAGVPEEETLTRRLESGTPGTEVINTGVPGYDLGQEYLFYKVRGRRYRPDLVLLAFFINDLTLVPELEVIDDPEGLPAAYRYRPEVERKLERRDQPTRNPITIVARWLTDHSALYLLIHQRLSSHGGGEIIPGGRDVFVFKSEYDEATSRAWERAYRILDDLKRLSIENGSRLAVILVPAPWQTSREAWLEWVASQKLPEDSLSRTRPQEMVTAWCARSATPCLDLREAFEQGDVHQLYFRHDQHWTSSGHRLAAMNVAQFLRANHLIGPRRPHHREEEMSAPAGSAAPRD